MDVGMGVGIVGISVVVTVVALWWVWLRHGGCGGG